MTIRLITTGGTIDKNYTETSGTLDCLESKIPEIIKTVGRSSIPEIKTTEVCRKDSSKLTHAEVIAIGEACQQSVENQIIVTHGTDTMRETAGSLASLELSDKVIVVTGSMRPYALGDSDALFNLGMAIAGVQLAEPGKVYIAMSGTIVEWTQIKKDFSIAQFKLI